MAVDKRYDDEGNVAVLYSPGFGAGWSTWNHGEYASSDLIFDADLVNAVLSCDLTRLHTLVADKYPDACTLGLDDLMVQWVAPGTRFEINEYDGRESLRLFRPDDGYTA